MFCYVILQKKHMDTCDCWKRTLCSSRILYSNKHSTIWNMELHIHLYCILLIIRKTIFYILWHPLLPLVWSWCRKIQTTMNILIDYLSKILLDSKTWYSHVEKSYLAIVISIQCFCYYILLRTTSILEYLNPMYYILTRQVLGGK